MSLHAARRKRLLSLLPEQQLETLLVTGETNVTYLTGFTGDSSYLLLTPAEAILLSDERYRIQLAQECPELALEIRGPGMKLVELVKQVVERLELRKLGLEADHVSLAQYHTLQEELNELEFVSTRGLVEGLRDIKDASEIAEIRRAIQIAERAFAVVRASLRPDQTELEVAHLLEQQIRLFGGKGCSFPPIVGVGPRAALPHGRPGETKIGADPLLLIDWGARAGLYISDLTRVLVTGNISPKLETIHGVVLEAQLAAIAAIRPGVPMQDVDAVAREVITRAGFGEQFGHGLGHGIGMQVHESPRLGQNQPRLIEAGMVLTVEPGIYFSDWGGVRIEDDVLVTETGAELLSRVPKALADCVVSW